MRSFDWLKIPKFSQRNIKQLLHEGENPIDLLPYTIEYQNLNWTKLHYCSKTVGFKISKQFETCLHQ
jgi:hypothetical protein